MKSIKRIILLVAVSLFIETANAQVSNPDTMIHKIFATLKAKDEKAFVALYPNATQFGKMIRIMMEKMLNSDEMKQMMAADEKAKNLNFDSLINVEVAKLNNPEVFAEMKKSFASSFQKIIEKGVKKGVNWAEANLVNYTLDSVSLDEEDMAMFKGSGIKNMKGVMDFTAGSTPYQMSFNKIVFLPTEGGWFGGEFPQLARKGESLEPEKEEVFDDAKAKAPIDTLMYNPPAEKIDSKTKTKTPASKTKTKIKTSVRKTKS